MRRNVELALCEGGGRPSVMAMMAVVCATACSGDAGTGPKATPSPSTPVAVVSTVVISPQPFSVAAGKTATLTATARDQNGRAMSGKTFAWSSDATLIARSLGSGAALGVTVGIAKFTATEQSSGRSATATVTVTAPARPAGSILALGTDSVSQFGSSVSLSTLGFVDTASAGSDHRVGILHVAGASPNASISRLNYPLFSAVAECPNGSAYATSFGFGTNNAVIALWSVDPRTAIITRIGSLGVEPDAVRSLGCDSLNRVLVSANFAGFGRLHRVDLTSGQVSVIQGAGSESYGGVTGSSDGLIYATSWNAFASPPTYRLMTRPASGSLVPVGSQRHPGILSRLVFSGSRLLGFLGNRLVEVDRSTGSSTSIRDTRIP